MLLPTTLLTASASNPWVTELKLTNNSGALVPNDTTVRPIHQLGNAENQRQGHRALNKQFAATKKQGDSHQNFQTGEQKGRHRYQKPDLIVRFRPSRARPSTQGPIPVAGLSITPLMAFYGVFLNHISTRNIRGDVFGGVTAAVVALPMALAFGVASGAGAAAGLWGAVIIGLMASLFGGTPTLISEPTGPMTVVFTAVILSFTSQIPDRGTALAMAFTVVVLAGVFQILFGFFRLGRYITMMPYTVISGFMSGIGVILVILPACPFSWTGQS